MAIFLGKKFYPNRFWCKCPICKSTGDNCGIMVDRRSLKYGLICSDCRKGNHCNKSKAKYPFKTKKKKKRKKKK